MAVQIALIRGLDNTFWTLTYETGINHLRIDAKIKSEQCQKHWRSSENDNNGKKLWVGEEIVQLTTKLQACARCVHYTPIAYYLHF